MRLNKQQNTEWATVCKIVTFQSRNRIASLHLTWLNKFNQLNQSVLVAFDCAWLTIIAKIDQIQAYARPFFGRFDDSLY